MRAGLDSFSGKVLEATAADTESAAEAAAAHASQVAHRRRSERLVGGKDHAVGAVEGAATEGSGIAGVAGIAATVKSTTTTAAKAAAPPAEATAAAKTTTTAAIESLSVALTGVDEEQSHGRAHGARHRHKSQQSLHGSPGGWRDECL